MTARMIELLGPLSIATDAANGMGPLTAVRASIVAVSIARARALPAETVRDVYWTALLRFLGCTSFAHETAERIGAGDDRAALRALMSADSGRPSTVLASVVRGSASGTLAGRARALATAMGDRSIGAQLTGTHCDAAQALAGDLGAPPGVVRALGDVFERWDGIGLPRGKRGDAIDLAARVVQVAVRAETHRALVGPREAIDEVAARAGRELDPVLCATFADIAGEVMPSLAQGAFATLVALEPASIWRIEPGDLERVALAFARYVDLKSRFTLAHSTGLAALVDDAARLLGWAGEVRAEARLAALLHDLGRTAVPNAIWDAPRALDPVERERARAHSYETERILALSPLLAPLAPIASGGHERLDGSGYHRGSERASPASRLLAACDVLHALSEERPHRPARSLDDIAALLRDEVRGGRLEAQAVDAALSARGVAPRERAWPDGLSEREVEVLVLVARGLSNKEIAARLGLSPKTVQHHVAHVYDKTGARTRAAAALYAVRRGIVSA